MIIYKCRHISLFNGQIKIKICSKNESDQITRLKQAREHIDRELRKLSPLSKDDGE